MTNDCALSRGDEPLSRMTKGVVALRHFSSTPHSGELIRHWFNARGRERSHWIADHVRNDRNVQ